MMSARGVLIHLDGSYEFRQIDGYEDIIAAVGGNFDWSAPGKVTYYCYEYALFERKVNPVATSLYWSTHFDEKPGIGDSMCGDVLVMGPPVNENDSDIPGWFVGRLARAKDEVTAQAQANGVTFDDLVVPLTPQEIMEVQARMIAAQNQANEALRQGKSVDFGGAILQAGQTVDLSSDPFTSARLVEYEASRTPIDGNRRQGGKS